MIRVCDGIDRLNEVVGRTFSCLILALLAVQMTVVVLRYVFGLGTMYGQEGVVYIHAILFMSVAGYTLLHEGHVRIDVIYRDLSTRRKAVINAAGVVFLLFPGMGMLLWHAIPYVVRSWRILEGSSLMGGIPGVFVLKTFILVFAILVLLQGVSLLVRSLSVLMRQAESPQVP